MRSVELVVNKPVGRLMSFPVFDSCSEGPMTQNYAIEKRKSSKKTRLDDLKATWKYLVCDLKKQKHADKTDAVAFLQF